VYYKTQLLILLEQSLVYEVATTAALTGGAGHHELGKNVGQLERSLGLV